MSGMRLTIATPAAVLAEAENVVSIRAEDATGSFGLLPGCADLLTVLPASVARWRGADGAEQFCALRGGVLTATGGSRVSIACREGVLGGDLAELEADARTARAASADAAAKAKVEQTRLHAGAVRQLMRYLRPAGFSESLFADGEGDGA